VTAFYEQLMRQPFEQLDVARCVAAWPEPKMAEMRARELFPTEQFVDTAIAETVAKTISRAELGTQLERLRAVWPVLREKLRAQLIPFDDIKRRLQAVGAPTEPEEIGLTRERVRASFLRAQHIRRRFTVLDLAVRTGTLASTLDVVFGPAGVWPINRQNAATASS
jgi:glycerol-1-phosphate dehydrogenase [NAD(P)+]